MYTTKPEKPFFENLKPHMPTSPIKTGLIFAMEEEQQGLEAQIQNSFIQTIGKRRFIQGHYAGAEVICVLSGIGKVAAASTTSLLIHHFKVNQIVLTGVAGACDPSLRRGDIVIAENLLQHDMDATPIVPRFEVPLTKKTRFAASTHLNQQLQQAIQSFLSNDLHQLISEMDQKNFQLQNIQVKQGLIASGDQFISDSRVLAELKKALPDLLAVEMEGAAIAQVCHDFEMPFAIVRTISDNANEDAHTDFHTFVKTVAAPYSLGILRQFFQLSRF